ncbi:MAG TPA: GNAT family N-acetyltransferase [Chthonomonadales bacterium]|nr:GNAT family N-acetyltransferase [Chthonomonadales bacterium]
MKPWTFRDAEPADWPSITGLLSEAHLPLEGAHDRLGGFLLAFRGDDLVGCGCLERYQRTGLLRGIAVLPSERGNGLGRELVGRLLESARRDALEMVVIITATASDYFRRFGFNHIERASVPVPLQNSLEYQITEGANILALSLSGFGSRGRSK